MAPVNSAAELERCVKELGFIGCNLNPDPSGGHWTAPPLTDRHWYPLYEKMVELDVPAMVHVSASCNPNFHATGAHYINADTTAFMQFLTGDLFNDFPTLRFIIPHGGGAVPYHWGRYRGLAQDMKRPPLADYLLKNVFFDTCVYHLPGIELLLKVIPVDNILFGSEMVGAVRGIDPETGQYFDDTKRYLDALPLSDGDRYKIFEGNARRVFPRLAAGSRADLDRQPGAALRRGAVHDLAADHGRDHARLADGLGRYGENILRQNRKIRQLAHFQRADLLVGKGGVSRTFSIGAYRIGHADPLFGNVDLAGDAGSALSRSIQSARP